MSLGEKLQLQSSWMRQNKQLTSLARPEMLGQILGMGIQARRPAWPDDAVCQRLVLDVESEHCERCGRGLHVCDHRFHRIHTLQGPLELVCRLAHCSDRACPARCQTLSPAAELSLTLPWWLIGWD